MNRVDETAVNLAIAEAEAVRWRNLAMRALAVLAGCGERKTVRAELGQGWICLACGTSGRNPPPPVCPRCGTGETGDGGPLPGPAAALEAREIVRGRHRQAPPQEGAMVGEGRAPEGRQRIEIVRFCPLCRAECPAEATTPEDCPGCHGRGPGETP